MFILITTSHYMRQSVWYLILASLTHFGHYAFSMVRPIAYDLRAYILAFSMYFSFIGFHVFDYECLAFRGVYIFRCERHFPHRLSISCLRH